jgi:hypothetical protein
MIDERKRMPLEELKQTPEYRRLTGKQQMFIETYVAGGLLTGHYDPIEAVLTAYVCKSRETARTMSYAVTQNIRVIAVLNRHFNTAPVEDFLVLLDRAINNKHLSIAQLQALRLKCDILGFANRLPTENAPTGVIPKDVLEATEAARKAQRKPRTPRKSPTLFESF